jgi:hypothetical protein
MTIYTVHAPPLKSDQVAPDPERFAFVRDGFYFWAFILAPLWMLWRRLWLVFVLYIVGSAVLQVGLWLIGASPLIRTVVGLLCALLVGLEAATLRRWTLNRRRWTQVGVVSGANQEAAERRFFDVWVLQKAWSSGPAQPSPPPPQPARMSPPASDIIGLFPEPQSRQ